MTRPNALSHRQQHQDTRHAIEARLGRKLAWIQLHDLQHHIARQRRTEQAHNRGKTSPASNTCPMSCHGCHLTATWSAPSTGQESGDA